MTARSPQAQRRRHDTQEARVGILVRRTTNKLGKAMCEFMAITTKAQIPPAEVITALAISAASAIATQAFPHGRNAALQQFAAECKRCADHAAGKAERVN